MAINKLGLTFLFFVILSSTGLAQQTKIGYANIDLILANMPETKSMNQLLQTAENALRKKFQLRQEEAQKKLAEYQSRSAQSPPLTQEEVQRMEQELMKLDQEIQQEAQQAEVNLMGRRQELMQPITTKLDNEIQNLAAAEGYKMILNTKDGSGASIILYGPPEHDLTRKILTRMGIPIPPGVNEE